MNASDITQEQFDGELVTILSEMKASDLLSIPGIYEIVSEEFNNVAIDNIIAKGVKP